MTSLNRVEGKVILQHTLTKRSAVNRPVMTYIIEISLLQSSSFVSLKFIRLMTFLLLLFYSSSLKFTILGKPQRKYICVANVLERESAKRKFPSRESIHCEFVNLESFCSNNSVQHCALGSINTLYDFCN